MSKILCFISEDMADFEITLVLHKLKNIGRRDIVAVGYTLDPICSESGLRYLPDITLAEAFQLDHIQGLLIPGGPIHSQEPALTDIIRKLDAEKKLLAAICNGPQYLGRAGILTHRKFTTSCSPEKIAELQVSDPFPRQNYLDQRVVRDGHVITAQGRAFVDFAFEIFTYLHIYEANPQEQLRLFQDIVNRKT
ncbi:MAG: DJ-1/PfpI family protein [Chloroflexi bacterium]|nr:DJ-1/PfpI family protein [Chloroflexota bacterium]